MKSYAYILLIACSLSFCTNKAFSQENELVNKLLRQDSTKVYNSKHWFNLSFGVSATPNPDRVYLYFPGLSIAYTYIDKDFKLYKFKSTFNSGLDFLDYYDQYSVECNFMTGKIMLTSTTKRSVEFYYGIGLVFGRKRAELLYMRGKWYYLPFHLDVYRYQNFLSVGFPFEFKVQRTIYGIGIDGNINYYLPYVGVKSYFRIGKDYVKRIK